MSSGASRAGRSGDGPGPSCVGKWSSGAWDICWSDPTPVPSPVCCLRSTGVNRPRGSRHPLYVGDEEGRVREDSPVFTGQTCSSPQTRAVRLLTARWTDPERVGSWVRREGLSGGPSVPPVPSSTGSRGTLLPLNPLHWESPSSTGLSGVQDGGSVPNIELCLTFKKWRKARWYLVRSRAVCVGPSLYHARPPWWYWGRWSDSVSASATPERRTVRSLRGPRVER